MAKRSLYIKIKSWLQVEQLAEALRKALKKCPEAKAEEIVIDYIQSADVMIL